MQNKGLIRVFAFLLGLICVYYLSFSVVTSHYNKKAKEYAQGDTEKEYKYLDSIGNKKVWLGSTYKQCLDRELGLGLDLKGGMNIVMEVSVPDILRALSDYNQSPNFTKSLDLATQMQKTTGNKSYLDLFVSAYKQIDPQGQLSSIFSTVALKDRISLNSTNDEVVRVLQDNINSAISNSFNVLRTRIDRFGVVQPNLQRLGNTGRILIELPGIKEPERVRKLLQGSANLEFWETYDYSEISKNISDVNTFLANNEGVLHSVQTSDTTKSALAMSETQVPIAAKDTTKTVSAPMTKEDSLKLALANASKTMSASDTLNQISQFRKNNPLFALLNMSGNSTGPVVGRVAASDTAEVNRIFALKQVRELLPPDLSLRWSAKSQVAQNLQEFYEIIAIKQPRGGRAPLSGSAISNAKDDFAQGSANANVSMSMNTEGARIWSKLTKENIGKCIAISLDGLIYSYPVVQTQIDGGQSQINGRFTPEEAKDLANTLNSGKMPAPARIVSEEVIGPSLGHTAIHNGLISFIIAFVLILLFMIFYYGTIPGLVADTALLLNVFLIFGILASFSAVLTMPGIAGIVLTLGMAVDANVLIYERIREEKLAGKSQRKAVADGYKAALSAIIDSNLTTMLTGIILFAFGTGPIRGFATTLIIGLITSFFTAVFISRLIFDWILKKEDRADIPFCTKLTKNWLLHPNIDFIGIRKRWYIISGSVLLICVISLFTRGLNQGIDFSGGRNYQVQFDKEVQIEQVRNMLKGAFEGTNSNLNVIAIGTTGKQVRISTNFKINDNSNTLDNEIEGMLYENLKPLLDNNESQDQFVKQNIVNSQKVGPAVAEDIKVAAIWVVILAVIGIALYIFVRFPSFTFSIGALASLGHDVLLIIGLYSLLYGIMPFSLEIDQSFIAAILTILGYSINDTVVIYDRIREYKNLYPKREVHELMDDAMNHTLRRTINTSLSVILVLLAIFLFGGDVIRGFIFALLIGVVTGTYSSILVASTITYDLQLWQSKRQKRKAEALLSGAKRVKA